MVFALLLVIMLAGESMLKGFISMFIGLFLATIGTDLFSGQPRFTGNQIELAGGIEFIALSVGIFAVGEVLGNIEEKTDKQMFKVPNKIRELLPSVQDVARSKWAMLQGSVVGFLIGILPGPARRSPRSSLTSSPSAIQAPRGVRQGLDRGGGRPGSREQLRNGRGDGPAVDHGHSRLRHGCRAPRRAGALRPQPGTAALPRTLRCGLADHREHVPGQHRPARDEPADGAAVRELLNTPYKVLYPAILLISVVGVYSVNFSIFDVWLLVVFGLLGYVMRKLDIPPAPLVLAFVLGPIAENAIRQSCSRTTARSSTYNGRSPRSSSASPCVLLSSSLSVAQGARQVIEVDV